MVNHKKIQRLWREEGLRVPRRRRRKRHGTSTAPTAVTADAPNRVWAVDFQFDATTEGRPIKIVSIIDEHTLECLGGLVERSITGEHLIGELGRLAGQRGTYPAVLRCDNGPELACGAMADWASGQVGLHFIPPGEPWRNGHVESSNSRIRDECLNINSFWSLAQARVVISEWKHDYNHHRRHSALDLHGLPAGHRRLEKKSASPSGPEASAQAVALRAAARRPESEGRKASITHRAAMPSTCVHVDLATSPNSLADQAVFRRVCMTAESLPTDCVGAAMREEHPVASDGSARKFCTGVALGRPRLVMNGYRRGECRR